MNDEALASLFPIFDAAGAKLLAARVTLLSLAAGQTAWTEGEPAGSLAFILAGRLELKKETEFTGSHVVVGLYGPGSVIGESCAFTARRALTAKALEPAELALLSSADIAAICEEAPKLGVQLLKFLLLSSSQRLDQSYRRIASVF